MRGERERERDVSVDSRYEGFKVWEVYIGGFVGPTKNKMTAGFDLRNRNVKVNERLASCKALIFWGWYVASADWFREESVSGAVFLEPATFTGVFVCFLLCHTTHVGHQCFGTGMISCAKVHTKETKSCYKGMVWHKHDPSSYKNFCYVIMFFLFFCLLYIVKK